MIEVSHPAAALHGLADNTATPDDVAFRLLAIPALAGAHDLAETVTRAASR